MSNVQSPEAVDKIAEIQRAYRIALTIINQSIAALSEELASLDRIESSPSLMLGSEKQLLNLQRREEQHLECCRAIAELQRVTDQID